MAKKGTRPAKVSQQKAREEQWKRRLTTPGRDDVGALVSDGPELGGDGAGETMASFSEAEMPTATMAAAPRTTTATRSTGSVATARNTASSTTVAAAQRRAATAARTARTRATANAMSMDDEMYYVRSDIRRLIMLTVVCVLVLIALFFVIPR